MQETHTDGSDMQEFFALPPRGRLFDYTMHGVDPQRYTTECGSGVAESLNFSLVQAIAGGVVSVYKWPFFCSNIKPSRIDGGSSAKDCTMTF